MFIELPSRALRDMLTAVKIAADVKAERSTNRCAQFTWTLGALEIATIDTARLAVANCPLLNSSGPGAALVAVASLPKNLPARGNIRLEITDTSLLIGAHAMPLVDACFPNYSKVIPPRFDNYVTLDRAVLLAAVTRIRAALKAEAPSSARRGDQWDTLTVVFNPGELRLIGWHGDAHEWHDHVWTKRSPFAGEVEIVPAQTALTMTTAFNVHNLAQMLATLTGPTIEVGFHGAINPFMVREKTAGFEYLYMIMPRRVPAGF